MATTYSRESGIVSAMVRDRLRVAHPKLAEVGTEIGVLMAQSDNDKPAVKHGGYPAFATIKVVAHKDRVTKGYDAELVIDARAWEDFGDRQRCALIAHELQHLELVEKA